MFLHGPGEVGQTSIVPGRVGGLEEPTEVSQHKGSHEDESGYKEASSQHSPPPFLIVGLPPGTHSR